MAKNISRLGETERLAIRAKAAETLGNLDAL
jgi:hypothetical protein